MAKYIDADKLKAEIEKRLKNIRDYMRGTGMRYKGPKYFKAQGKESAYDALLNVLDSLQQEQPEQPTRGYDEAYLNDCIAKAKKSWEGVDVDKYMDMVRGKEPVIEELVEEVKRYYSDNYSYITGDQPTLSIVTNIARHFAQWGAEHSGDKKRLVMVRKERIEDHINELNDKYLGGVYSSYDMAKAYAEGNIDGQKWQKEQIMKEAADGEVVKDINNKLAVTAKINLDGFKFGDKVKLIVIKED